MERALFRSELAPLQSELAPLQWELVQAQSERAHSWPGHLKLPLSGLEKQLFPSRLSSQRELARASP
jgi:hypothetical protein